MISERVLRGILEIIVNDTSGETFEDYVDVIMELARNTKFGKERG